MENKVRKYLAILALSLSGGTIYIIPFIRYIFYDHQIAATGMTNTQIGLLTTVYGIIAMILYVPGGMAADKYSTKMLMSVSLLTTTALTVLYAYTMQSYTVSLIIWILLAISTAFVFWGSLFKTIRMISTEKEQGFIFGLYYMGNGITGAVVGWIAFKLMDPTTSMLAQFQVAVLTCAASTFVAALAIIFILKEDRSKSKELKTNQFDLSQVKGLVKQPVIWIFALIVFAGYSVYSSSSYFTPYLTEVVGISPEDSGILSIFRTYIFYILAPLSGLFADKVLKSTSKWFMFLFVVLAILFVGVLFIPEGASVSFVSLYTLLPGAFGLALYGIVFSIASETGISVAVMGTAVGIASIIGYSPDMFMSTMFGVWLDKFGATGYNYIFLFLGAVCAMGAIASFIVNRMAKKNRQIAK